MASVRNVKEANIHHIIDWEIAFPFYLWNIWLQRYHNYHNKKSMDIPLQLPYPRVVEYHYYTNQRETRKYEKI